jgi:hypothetical protein
MTVGGIDPNSHKIVIVSTRRRDRVKPFVHVGNLVCENLEDRVNEAFDFVFDYCMGVREYDESPPRLYLEAPVMGVGGVGATIPQTFVSGGIIAGASQAGARITLVNNQTWKKRVCGNGSINKLTVSKWVEDNWELLYKKAPIITTKSGQGVDLMNRADQDWLDAGCLNLHGWKNEMLIERLARRRNA